MPKNTDTHVILGDDLKERIANADMSNLIDLLAELLADQRIRVLMSREVDHIGDQALEEIGPKPGSLD